MNSAVQNKPRLVIKVGTNSLLNDSSAFQYIAESVRMLASDHDVLIVTSGAIGFGMKEKGLTKRPTEVGALQALSMLGQVGLLRQWREALAPMPIGQILVTSRELVDDRARGSLIDGLESLWQLGAIPVVNENDAITTQEITFGDNDKLAAEVAVALKAKALVLLTDQDGILEYFGQPNQAVIPMVAIESVEQYISGGAGSGYGKGGADSKVFAARIALSHEIPTYIANASRRHSVEHALQGFSGTKIY